MSASTALFAATATFNATYAEPDVAIHEACHTPDCPFCCWGLHPSITQHHLAQPYTPAKPRLRSIASQTDPVFPSLVFSSTPATSNVRITETPFTPAHRLTPAHPTLRQTRASNSHSETPSITPSERSMYERLCNELPQLRPHLIPYLAQISAAASINHSETASNNHFESAPSVSPTESIESAHQRRYDRNGMRLFEEGSSMFDSHSEDSWPRQNQHVRMISLDSSNFVSSSSVTL